MTLSAPALVTLLACAALCDWRFRRIPNGLFLSFLAAGLIFQCWAGQLSFALLGAGCAFLLTVVPVWLRGMGMGDQKLLMAVGVWAGAAETYRLFAYAIVISLAVLACQPQRWRRTLRNLRTLAAGWAAHREIWLPERGESALSLPFAVCLFAACCLRLWKG